MSHVNVVKDNDELTEGNGTNESQSLYPQSMQKCFINPLVSDVL